MSINSQNSLINCVHFHNSISCLRWKISFGPKFFKRNFLLANILWTNIFIDQNFFQRRIFYQNLSYNLTIFGPKYSIQHFLTLNLFDPRIILEPKFLEFCFMLSWIKKLLFYSWLKNFKSILRIDINQAWIRLSL